MSFSKIVAAICLCVFSTLSFSQPSNNSAPKASPVTLDFQVLEQPSLTIRDVMSARLMDSACTSSCVIGVKFNDQGAKKLAQIARTHVGQKMAIVLNGKLISTPKIMTEIAGGEAQIDGEFNKITALELIDSINKAPK